MLDPITRQMADNSTDTQFSFSFYCDICGHVWSSIPLSFSGDKGAEKSGSWKSEHEAAYERANREAMMYFNRCPVCKHWVCDDCFLIREDGYICKECLGQESQEKEFSNDDIEKNRIMAGLAYIVFFLPLLSCPDSKFARFHANQSLLLLIAGISGSIILSIIPLITQTLLLIFSIAVFAVAVMHMLGALSGKAKELPFIGWLRLLK